MNLQFSSPLCWL